MTNSFYIFLLFNLKLFVNTDIELIDIAAPAIIGLNRNPKVGYKAPGTKIQINTGRKSINATICSIPFYQNV